MKKTRRQLEEDLRQAEQDLDEAKLQAEASRIAASMLYDEYRALRRENDAILGWARALKRHLEKDVLPKGLL